jgi:hypothetical protein
MVKTELNIVEANFTRVCGVILIDQSKKAGGVKPSVLPSISKFLSIQAYQDVRYGWSILLRF